MESPAVQALAAGLSKAADETGDSMWTMRDSARMAREMGDKETEDAAEALGNRLSAIYQDALKLAHRNRE